MYKRQKLSTVPYSETAGAEEAALEEAAAEDADESLCFLVSVKMAKITHRAAAAAHSTQSRVLVECFKNRPPK